jgi:hypothetical protein
MIIEKCNRCASSQTCDDQVIARCLPVPTFGDLTKPHLKVVTIGLNPSLTEFVINEKPKDRSVRLAMLEDYGRESRTDLNDTDVMEARARRENYFQDKKRDWHSYFEKLESVLYRVNPAWTYAIGSAAHIDVVACATKDNWGFLSKHKPEALKQIVSNCGEYFSKSISHLPNGTIILCNGQRAWIEVASLGKSIGKFEMKPSIPYNELGDIIRIGELTCGQKTYPVRGWTMPANYLTSFLRFDLAYWVHGTLFPPETFASCEALNPTTCGVAATPNQWRKST